MNTGIIVEIFKTNVEKTEDATLLLGRLAMTFPEHKINFDLDDCDNILRIEGEEVNTQYIESFMRTHGYECETLN